MDELKDFLLTQGFTLVRIDDEYHYIFSKAVEGIEFIYLLVAPHDGNGNRYMFRANPIDTFDKWSNCDFQRFYKDKEDFKNNWNKYLIFDYDECN